MLSVATSHWQLRPCLHGRADVPLSPRPTSFLLCGCTLPFLVKESCLCSIHHAAALTPSSCLNNVVSDLQRSRAGRVRMPPLKYWANEHTVRDKQGHLVAIQRPRGSAQTLGKQPGRAQALPGKQPGEGGSSARKSARQQLPAGALAGKAPGKAADAGRKAATRGGKGSKAAAGSKAHATSHAQQEGSEAAADCGGDAQPESDSLCTLPAWGLRQQRSRASPAKPGAEGPPSATGQAGSQGGGTKILLGKRKCPEPSADTDSNASSEGNELPDSARAASRPGADPGPEGYPPPVAAAEWQHATAQVGLLLPISCPVDRLRSATKRVCGRCLTPECICAG